MGKRGLYIVGRAVAGLMWLAAAGGLVWAYGRAQGSPAWPGELYGVLVLAAAVGVVAHEFGHLLACLAVGAEVKTFRLGHERAAIKFRVGKVRVFLGWPYQGRVEHGGRVSAGQRVVITLAGSLADLALAGLVLLSLAIAHYGRDSRALAVAVALGIGVTGLANLMPFRSRSGRLSDGARLLEVPSVGLAVEALDAQKTAGRLLRAGRAQELLTLHAGLKIPARGMGAAQAVSLTVVEFDVALLPGLPNEAASLAERRVSWLMQSHDLGRARSIADLTLALLRLRLGGPGSQADAERLCRQVLARKDVTDSARLVALAAIAVSRQARRLPYEDVRAAAPGTPRAAKPGLESMVARLTAALDPEAFLDAFRKGAPGTRLGAGSLAATLRRQDRLAELLEMHKAFGLPAGSDASAQARSLHEVIYNLLLVPRVPRAEIDEAAIRVQWILANYPFEAQEDTMPRAGVEHTLALARLRQARFAEVEPLCAAGLAGNHDPDTRATILATVVLARRALGQPHADLLGKAVALSPDADLVAEARGTAGDPVTEPLHGIGLGCLTALAGGLVEHHGRRAGGVE